MIALPTAGWFHRRSTTLSLFALLSLVCYIDRFILGAVPSIYSVRLVNVDFRPV
jgi:hypothetical protein